MTPVQFSLTALAILVRVETNGRFHLRYRVGHRTVDDGRCHIDENWVESDWSELDRIDSDQLCRFCFPESVSAIAEPAVGTGAM